MTAYPWKLRLVHEGHASVRVERDGTWIRFDPWTAPEPEQLAILTWNEPERTRGVRTAIAAGAKPRVVATPHLRGWLGGLGALDDRSPGGTVDGVRVDAVEYSPVPYAHGAEVVHKAKAGLARPWMAVQRLKERARLPDALPLVVQLTFPDGTRLLHLNCCLHQGTEAAWVATQQERFAGADWVMVGVDYGEDAAVRQHIAGFKAKKVLVSDLLNDTRRELGLPTSTLTPLVDQLVADGLEAFPFVEGCSVRVE